MSTPEEQKELEKVQALKKLLNIDKIQFDLESMRQNFDSFRQSQGETNAKVDAIFNAINEAQVQRQQVPTGSATQQPSMAQVVQTLGTNDKMQMIQGIAELVKSLRGGQQVSNEGDFGNVLKDMFVQWLRTQTDAFMIHTYPDAKDYIKSPWWQKGQVEHGP